MIMVYLLLIINTFSTFLDKMCSDLDKMCHIAHRDLLLHPLQAAKDKVKCLRLTHT